MATATVNRHDAMDRIAKATGIPASQLGRRADAGGAEAVATHQLLLRVLIDVYTCREIRRLQALPHNTKIEGEV